MPENLVCVGKITSPHGVKGAVKVKSFTADPLSLGKYSPLYNKDGSEEFEIQVVSSNLDMFVVKIEGVNDRNEAALLRNRELYADKDLFPALEEDEFFYEDLIGMRAKLENGKEFGNIIAVHDYGGGDVIEIKLANSRKTELFAFTKEIFPIVNVERGFVVIRPPKVEFID